MTSVLKTSLVLVVVISVFSGLVLTSHIEESNDVELYKVKIWKHVQKTNGKVCWDKNCSESQYKK